MITIYLDSLEKLKANGELPSPRGTALAIMRLTRQEDVDLHALERTIKADPAFVGRLLKAANAAHHGSQRPVVSVHDAISRLGLSMVRNLALGFSLIANYQTGGCARFDYRRFWSRSLLCGLAHHATLSHLSVATSEEGFVCGLLSEIGQLAFATLYPEDYSYLIEQAAGSLAALRDLEKQSFSLDHNDLTLALLSDWGFPMPLLEPIYFHEEPDHTAFADGSRGLALTRSLALASYLADICLADERSRGGLMSRLYLIGSQLGIPAAELNAMCDRIAMQWLEWGALLGVEAVVVPKFETLSSALPVRMAGADEIPQEMRDGVDTLERPVQSQGLRVLVVSTRLPALQKQVIESLGRAEVQIFAAESGQSALERALTVDPGIIVIDAACLGVGAVALVRELRRCRVGTRLYVLMLLDAGEEAVIAREASIMTALDAGADDYLFYPPRHMLDLKARLRAGLRVVTLQDEVERDREEIKKFATELARTHRQLRDAAMTDPLTGFHNRRYANDRLEQEWASASRSGAPLSCMMVDLDGFKGVNDRFGHEAGDTLLRQVALVLKRGLRLQDTICRLGGDEFLVVCPGTDLHAAVVCAERLRLAVESLNLKYEGATLKCTLSIGVADRQNGMEAAPDLVRAADAALYQAKSAGRNRLAVKGADMT